MSECNPVSPYAELFEVIAGDVEVDERSGLVLGKVDEETLARWRAVRDSFINSRGYSLIEFTQLALLVEQDVSLALQEINSATPADFID